MKYLRLNTGIAVVAIVVVMTAINAAAQMRTGGEVLEVVDGKTVTVGVPSGRLTVEIQYIDVPEPGQSLHDIVKDHVRAMLVGRSVELQTNGFKPGKFVGKLMLNGVDVGQQLLRNGAAWHLAIEMSGQNKDEFAAYAESESLARQEKRGVWSVANLEPAWKFREKQKLQATAASKPVSDTSAQSSVRKKGYWSDTNPRLKNPGAISHGFNAATQTGFLGTLMGGIKDDKAAAAGQKAAVGFTYYYTENEKTGRTGYFVARVVSLGDNFRFLKSNDMTIEVDGKKFVVGKPDRIAGTAAFDLAEQLTYRVDRSIIEKITYGAEVVIKIGDYMITPRTTVLQTRLYTILEHAK